MRRKFARRKYSRRKRTLKPAIKRKWTRKVAEVARREIGRACEYKYAYINTSTNFDITGGAWFPLIAPIAQGTGYSYRIGAQVKVRRLTLKMFIQLQPVAGQTNARPLNQIRVAICRFKQVPPDGVSFVDIVEDTSSLDTNGIYSQLDKDIVRVYKDNRYVLSNTLTGFQTTGCKNNFTYNYSVNFPVVWNYVSQSTDVSKDVTKFPYVFIWSDQATSGLTQCVINYACKVSFMDP